jgi:transcriptional regulator
MMQGTVDLLILKSLQRGAAHGYAVSRWVHERTDGVLTIEDAALYQALHRLEARGLVEAEWGLSDNNRKAKYYSLTPDGRQQLRSDAAMWKKFAQAMFKVLDPA